MLAPKNSIFLLPASTSTKHKCTSVGYSCMQILGVYQAQPFATVSIIGILWIVDSQCRLADDLPWGGHDWPGARPNSTRGVKLDVFGDPGPTAVSGAKYIKLHLSFPLVLFGFSNLSSLCVIREMCTRVTFSFRSTNSASATTIVIKRRFVQINIWGQ